MQRTDKEQIVAELAEQLGSTDTLIVADYRGLTNKQLEALRDELLQHRARFRIVKNTLTRRAAELAGAESLLVLLEGPTAIAFIESGGDPAAVAKTLAATARETSVLSLRGGVLEGETLTGDEIETLAKLPSAEVLRGQLLGAIIAPLTQLVALVTAPLQDLYGLIDARIKQLEDEGEFVEPVSDATAVVTADEATPGEVADVTEPGEATEATEKSNVPADESDDAGDPEPGADAPTAEAPSDSASPESDAHDSTPGPGEARG